MQTCYFYSSLGWVKILTHGDCLIGMTFTNEVPLAPQYMDPFQQTIVRQLEEYLAGKRKTFTIPVRFSGTSFQQRIYRCLLDIPYGQTKTYGEVAELVGKPLAARAVGAACRANPLHLIVPCHRVIGRNGKLTGYAGGIQRKNALLRLENSDFHS